MEWNSARLKWPVLSGQSQDQNAAKSAQSNPLLATQSFVELCKVGLAFTWPLALALLAVTVLVILLLRH
jgi:hypothetical protein